MHTKTGQFLRRTLTQALTTISIAVVCIVSSPCAFAYKFTKVVDNATTLPGMAAPTQIPLWNASYRNGRATFLTEDIGSAEGHIYAGERIKGVGARRPTFCGGGQISIKSDGTNFLCPGGGALLLGAKGLHKSFLYRRACRGCVPGAGYPR